MLKDGNFGRSFGADNIAPAKQEAKEVKKESTVEKIKGFMSKVGEFFKKFESVDVNSSPEKLAEMAEEMIRKGQELKELAESRKAEKFSEDYDEAHEKNIEMDHEAANITNEKLNAATEAEMVRLEEEARLAAEAMEKAEKEAVRVAEKERLVREADEQTAKDQIKAAEIMAKLQGGAVEVAPVKNVEAVAVERVENNDDALIEKIGAPKNETFDRYGSKMREAADELVSLREKILTNKQKLDDKNLEFKSAEWQALWNDQTTLNNRRNELISNASRGGKIIDEDPYQHENNRAMELKKYQETAMSDPYVVLRMVESDNLGYTHEKNEGIGKISEELRSDSEFMANVLNKISSRAAEGFWAHAAGGVARNKELYIKAVKKNHLNYQWGTNELKSDPEVKKAALESGLDSTYLQNG